MGFWVPGILLSWLLIFCFQESRSLGDQKPRSGFVVGICELGVSPAGSLVLADHVFLACVSEMGL